MCGRSLDGNREISRPTGGRKLSNRPASGRRGAIADDERRREGSPPALAKAPDPAIVAVKPTNKAGQPATEPGEPRAGTEGNADQQSTCRAQNRESVSQALDRVRTAARHRKKERFTTLFHHLSLDLFREAFLALKRAAAPGVDGLTWPDYEADLERNLTDLHDRVHRGAYRALPSRRRYIPKSDGRQRPLAVAALEDKIVQKATVAVLNAIYEEDFLGFSYGFRPRRSQHDALDALVVGITSTKVHYILDADIRSFFDHTSCYPPQEPRSVPNAI